MLTLLREAGNAASQFDLSRKASQCGLRSVGKVALSNIEMRCARGLHANQALQKMQLQGVQLSKTQMERLASSAMARFLYKGPVPCNAVGAQLLDAQSSVLPQLSSCGARIRAQPCGTENSSLLLSGFGWAVTGRVRSFMLSARRGYLLGRSSRGIVSVRGSAVRGGGNTGFDGDSPDASFFGKAMFWMDLCITICLSLLLARVLSEQL